jgi:hypothetical protein
MTTMDGGSTQRFNPAFPVFVPCRQAGARGTEVLRMNGRFAGDGIDSVCLPIFSSEDRCLSFGNSQGYDTRFRISDPKSLVHFLQQASATGVAYVHLDPQLVGPTQGVVPIEAAIQFLQHRAQMEHEE